MALGLMAWCLVEIVPSVILLKKLGNRLSRLLCHCL
jgi:hypothetical protein